MGSVRARVHGSCRPKKAHVAAVEIRRKETLPTALGAARAATATPDDPFVSTYLGDLSKVSVDSPMGYHTKTPKLYKRVQILRLALSVSRCH